MYSLMGKIDMLTEFQHSFYNYRSVYVLNFYCSSNFFDFDVTST